MSEDDLKKALEAWLRGRGWDAVEVKWGRQPGADIVATRPGARWVIECKGIGSLDAMRVNYFLGVLGELLQRMKEADSRYSVSLPDHRQYRGLWQRLPGLVKERLGITALFVDAAGEVEEVS